MPRNIWRVQWSASGLPFGIKFDEDNGTFSGTPDEAGMYLVPVQVRTNYGTSPVENVTIAVEDHPRPAYAIGSKAEQWSESASPDADGFRKLNIPDVNRLTALWYGFGARTLQGDWYVAGMGGDLFAAKNSQGACKSFSDVYPDFKAGSKPVQFPVNGVLEMSAGIGHSSTVEVGYRTSSDEFYYSASTPTGTSLTKHYYCLPNVKKLQEDYCTGLIGLNTERAFVGYSLGPWYLATSGAVKKIGVIDSSNTSQYCYCLMMDGRLYQYQAQNVDQIRPEYGDIRNFWFIKGTSTLRFIQTYDNKLYAMGDNRYGSLLGLPEAKLYNDFELVGYYSVKKITSTGGATFLLADNGRLYHSGKAVSGITDQHTTFTQIFPNKVFQDVIACPSQKTLIVTFKE